MTRFPPGMRVSIPKRLRTAIFFLVIGAVLTFACESSADMYKYVDRAGTVCFTNDLKKVPEEYRAQVVVIPQKHDDAKGRPPDKEGREAGGEKGRAEGFQWEKFRELRRGLTGGRLFMPVLVLILFLALFLAIGKVCAFLERRRLGLALRILLTLGVLFYLWKTL